uniref:Uncharacterized protein n=1 Tax=Anopheles melas TaxID=34690 RepID=A0A182TQI1_9DIPT
MAQFVCSGRAFRMRWCRLRTTLTIVRVEEIFIVEHHSCLGVILERDRAGLTNRSVCYFHYQRRRQRWVGRKNELLEDDADRGVCEPAFQKLKLCRLWMLPREVGEGDEGNVLAQSVEAAVYPLIALMQQNCRKNVHRIMRTFVPFVNTVRTTGVLRNQLHPAVLHVVDVRILCGLTSDESLYCTSAYDSTLVWDLIPDDIEQLAPIVKLLDRAQMLLSM